MKTPAFRYHSLLNIVYILAQTTIYPEFSARFNQHLSTYATVRNDYKLLIIIPILQAFISFQCIFAVLYLLVGKKLDRIANRLNLALLLVLATQMLFNLSNQYLLPNMFPPFGFGMALFYGPLLYLYLVALIYSDFTWTQRCWWHMIPGIVGTIAPAIYTLPVLLYALATFTSLSLYIVLSYRKLAYYQKVIRQSQSEFDRIALGWVRFLLIIMASALLLNIVSVVLSFVFVAKTMAILSEASVLLMLLIMVNSFLLKGLLHPEIFSGISAEDENLVQDNETKYRATTLEMSEQKELEARLLQHMESNKPYLNPMFNLKSLGYKLGENPRYLSQIINTTFDENFSDFVNRYRVEGVKACLLDDNETRSITELYLEFGFSTKSNFNRAFKKITGTTPSEIRLNKYNPSA